MQELLREQIINSNPDTVLKLIDLEIYDVLTAIQERSDLEEFAPIVNDKLNEMDILLQVEANNFKICGKKRPS